MRISDWSSDVCSSDLRGSDVGVMVKLTRIYTRGGDKGKNSLGGGERVAKHHPRVAAYGTVDEANAAVGLARLHTAALDDTALDDRAIDAILGRLKIGRAHG